MLKESKRQKSMIWWNNLRTTSIFGVKDKGYYTSLHYPFRMYQTLTGREIQNIWEKECP